MEVVHQGSVRVVGDMDNHRIVYADVKSDRATVDSVNSAADPVPSQGAHNVRPCSLKTKTMDKGPAGSGEEVVHIARETLQNNWLRPLHPVDSTGGRAFERLD